MYNPRLTRWDDLKKTEGLLIFAQRAQECLFDYALDSYKAPALNTHSRCEELRDVIRDVTDGRVASGNIKPVVEELSHSISDDIAATSLLGDMARDMQTVSWWAINNHRLLKTQADLLRGYLWRRAYEGELLRQLTEKVRNPNLKREILSLTTSLIVELVNAGYSKEYIYSSTKRFFFGVGGPRISSPAVIGDFFKLFERGKNRKSFDVLLRVSSAWKSLLGQVETDSVFFVLGEAPQPRRGLSGETRFLKQRHDGAYLLIKDVKAYEPGGARQRATTIVSVIADLGTCHSHRSLLSWAGDALVWEKDFPVVLRDLTKPIHKEDECSEAELPHRFSRTLTHLGPGRLGEKCWSRLAASLALHSAAV